jgi:hypothetical protein
MTSRNASKALSKQEKIAKETLEEEFLLARDPEQIKTWNARLDQVRKQTGLSSDAQVALLLNTTQPTISRARSGDRDLPWQTKLRVMDLLGYQWAREAILSLLPDQTAKSAIEWNNAVTRKVHGIDDKQN